MTTPHTSKPLWERLEAINVDCVKCELGEGVTVPTPLESFIEALQKPHTCEDTLRQKFFTHTSEGFPAPEANMKCELTLPDRRDDPSLSIPPLHTHTSEGFSAPMADLKCETKCEGSFTLPEPPIKAGWLVAYRDRRNRLHDGTVNRCEWTGTGWTIHLLNETIIPLRSVTSVAKTDEKGQILSAWTVREHGHDGEGSTR